MSIVDFLLARITEDEAAARESAKVVTARIAGPSSNMATGHVSFSAARVLAECQAKRAIIAEHGGRPPFHVDPCDAHDVDMRTIPCDTLRHLAAVCADHPDYQPEWRP